MSFLTKRVPCPNAHLCTKIPLDTVHGVAMCVNLLHNGKPWQCVCATHSRALASALSPVIQHVDVVHYGHSRRLQPSNGHGNTPWCHIACGIIFEIDQ